MFENFEAELAALLDCDNPPAVERYSDRFGPCAALTYDDGSVGYLFITSSGSVSFGDGYSDSPCYPGD